jgi:XisI protein
MDRLDFQRDAIQQILEGYDALNQKSDSLTESLIVIDRTHDQYLLILTGWNQTRRIRNVFFHVRLKNGKIWIEEDWSEDGFASELLSRGISSEEIVLAFQPPQVRPHTEFATV